MTQSQIAIILQNIYEDEEDTNKDEEVLEEDIFLFI